MKTLLLIIELLSGLLLIGAILIHSPKGEGIGSIGGPAKMFNSPQKDMEKGLDQFTYILTAVFLIIATILGVFY